MVGTRDHHLKSLLSSLRSATGPDREIDAAIASNLAVAGSGGDDPITYTASVDACITLVQNCLPDCHWHIGFGPTGILPYATLRADQWHVQAEASTVPLALLSALLTALIERQQP